MRKLCLVAVFLAAALSFSGGASARTTCATCLVLQPIPDGILYTVLPTFNWGPQFNSEDQDICAEHQGINYTWDDEGYDQNGNYYYIHVVVCNDGHQIGWVTTEIPKASPPTGPGLNNEPVTAPPPVVPSFPSPPPEVTSPPPVLPPNLVIAPLVVNDPPPPTSDVDTGNPGPVASGGDGTTTDPASLDDGVDGETARCDTYWTTGNQDDNPGGC